MVNATGRKGTERPRVRRPKTLRTKPDARELEKAKNEQGEDQAMSRDPDGQSPMGRSQPEYGKGSGLREEDRTARGEGTNEGVTRSTSSYIWDGRWRRERKGAGERKRGGREQHTVAGKVPDTKALPGLNK